MRKVTFSLALLLMSFGASAQMVDEPTCYSWEGGHKSSGSFSKCGPQWVIAKPAPKVVAAPAPAPMIAPSPIMMPMATCAPAPKPKPMVKKRKPLPVKC